MNIDTLQAIPEETKNTFDTQNEINLLILPGVFSKFTKKKNENPKLTFDNFLLDEATKEEYCFQRVNISPNWQPNNDRNILVTVNEYNSVKYALVPLEVVEKESNKIFKFGTKYILTPDNKVYVIS
jgi:hypothetical protein